MREIQQQRRSQEAADKDGKCELVASGGVEYNRGEHWATNLGYKEHHGLLASPYKSSTPSILFCRSTLTVVLHFEMRDLAGAINHLRVFLSFVCCM